MSFSGLRFAPPENDVLVPGSKTPLDENLRRDLSPG
jgi:hypothetical protein